MSEIITLAHGSGGKLTHQLIRGIFQKRFRNDWLLEGGDSAVLEALPGQMAFTTDSYVIHPLFFRGGNIGKLAVCGTVNDLAVCGAIPRYISCGWIIEEGFPIEELEKIAESMASAAQEAGVFIVTGDTKIVPRGCADKLFLNTSGVGFIPEGLRLSPTLIRPGDRVIVSGTIGDHGTAILIEREQLQVETGLVSDCAPLNGMLELVTASVGGAVRLMRDPTRGGVATTLNEFTEGQGFGIRLEEHALPVKGEVSGLCGMLGMDPLYIANEGKAILVVDGAQADRVLELLRSHPYGQDAAVIGEVVVDHPGKVYMRTLAGGHRIVDMLVGDQLPRIC
ncbi:hydrogenase expression/formation protein HypE [Paenibacillus forsythiae]|uniref:Hydrogenase expression/formation protein HypE n=1 Tax=Paenibacillus forsythiae TaxID=365616 RepID=A0ABU3H967_9BACL|nr:hydrogenase expression/formation protein HypE [Paenibacillus forsythiae]MDT3427377.1 hydrogenase expression/formation protein HypE [Paenibacillus forsythiae]